MNLDVCILAGGRGTRLRGVWDGPKCLVTVHDGRPVIEHLTNRALLLLPRRVFLLLGHGADQVIEWRRCCCPHRDVLTIPGLVFGTANAVCAAIDHTEMLLDVPAPLLVLNGDTLPLYDLAALVSYHEQRRSTWITAAFRHDSEAWRDVYAGACVLSVAAQREIRADERTRDFPAHLLGAQRFMVPGFLDVGTPEGFQRAKEWRNE